MNELSLGQLIEKVRTWASVRNFNEVDEKSQILKVFEEMAELAVAESEEDKKDAIGDTMVTLIILSDIIGYDFKSMVISHMQNKKVVNEDNLKHFNYYKRCLVEVGKLSEGSNKSDRAKKITAIRELFYITFIRSEFIERVRVKDALAYAYNEIKGRKGMIVNGSYVKYEDLPKDKQRILDSE